MSQPKRGKFAPTPDEMKVIDLLVEGVPADIAFSKCGVHYHNKSRNNRYRKVTYLAGKSIMQCVGKPMFNLNYIQTADKTKKKLQERKTKAAKRKWHEVTKKR